MHLRSCQACDGCEREGESEKKVEIKYAFLVCHILIRLSTFFLLSLAAAVAFFNWFPLRQQLATIHAFIHWDSDSTQSLVITSLPKSMPHTSCRWCLMSWRVSLIWNWHAIVHVSVYGHSEQFINFKWQNNYMDFAHAVCSEPNAWTSTTTTIKIGNNNNNGKKAIIFKDTKMTAIHFPLCQRDFPGAMHSLENLFVSSCVQLEEFRSEWNVMLIWFECIIHTRSVIIIFISTAFAGRSTENREHIRIVCTSHPSTHSHPSIGVIKWQHNYSFRM